MRAWLRALVTGIDNHTPDLARVLWLLGGIEFLALAAFDVWHSHHFDMISFGSGLGLVLTAGGFAVAVKSHTEPKQ